MPEKEGGKKTTKITTKDHQKVRRNKFTNEMLLSQGYLAEGALATLLELNHKREDQPLLAGVPARKTL